MPGPASTTCSNAGKPSCERTYTPLLVPPAALAFKLTLVSIGIENAGSGKRAAAENQADALSWNDCLPFCYALLRGRLLKREGVVAIPAPDRQASTAIRTLVAYIILFFRRNADSQLLYCL